MVKRVQIVRHDNTGAEAFTGKEGEITVNTTNDSLHIHDELTVGGHEIPNQTSNDLAYQAITAFLTSLLGLAGTEGILAKVDANTAALRTITGEAGVVTVTDGDGQAGNPTITLDNLLAAIAVLVGTEGILAKTADGAAALRTITGETGVVTVTDGNGQAGNPTITLDNLLAAIAALAGTEGYLVKTADGASALRTITGTASSIVVTNGNGTVGNPVIALIASAADKLLYSTAENVFAEADITAAGRALLDDATAAIQRATLGSTSVGDAVFIAASQAAAQAAIGVADTFGSKLLHVRDQKASGTAGGIATTGTYATRTLNTTLTNELSVTIAGNQIPLAAGDYYIEAFVPVAHDDDFSNTHTQAALYDATGAAFLINGSSATWNGVPGEGSSYHHYVTGRFTLAAPSSVEIRHYFSNARTTLDFGAPATSGQVEVYTDVRIWEV